MVISGLVPETPVRTNVHKLREMYPGMTHFRVKVRKNLFWKKKGLDKKNPT